jgi:hypothetical protein
MAAVTIVSVAAAVGTTALVWAAFESAAPARPELSAMLPQGALLTIETRDFAGLLKRWNDSPEKTAWLKSDNYSVFTRSRLLGRLTDAQQEFAQSAGLPPDMSFLDEVAGNGASLRGTTSASSSSFTSHACLQEALTRRV